MMSTTHNPEGDNAPESRQTSDSGVSTPHTTIGLAALHRVENNQSPTTYQAIRDVTDEIGVELDPMQKNDLRHAVDLAREKLHGGDH